MENNILDAQETNGERLSDEWRMKVSVGVCERCDWTFLYPESEQTPRCPRCFQTRLSPLSGQAADLPYIRPPEAILPFTISAERLDQAVQSFAKGIPFAPGDLNPQTLRSRLQRVYLPMWLVDADVQANWKAETGFNYQVVSHQDHFSENRGGWVSQEVKERRIRWEPRLGSLQRKYNNVGAPALEDHRHLNAAIGGYDLEKAAAYQAQSIEQAHVRLPDRPPQDAWTEAQPAFQAVAAEECRKAARADHIRQFSWEAYFQNQNWTLLLMPLYTTYYLDDERQAQPVLVNGQSARLSGTRRSSMKQAQKAALITLGIAALIFVISLVLLAVGLMLPVLLVIGVIGLAIALLAGAGAIAPLAISWWFNKGQTAPQRA